ncbi:hypothetical protein BC777_1468 [Yoonia maricola]|uniref:Extensin-like C-terminal domain-containing protein n=1 Tax=Yoonia maricola TaxID=420999 RepID=A0A2M8WNX8_9RHOB|nr:extensin family protein [Yoonia maricola]PJI92613.1 hypothetical protein BC777_1468 [Yoonia maricola]
MRGAAWLVALLLAGPALAQDIIRPVPRPTVTPEPAVELTPAPIIVVRTPTETTVRPIIRGSMQAQLAGRILRPITRPYERPDLEYGAQTRPLFRAERNLFAFSPYAVAQSPRPDLRPASIEAAAEERRIARLRGQVCGDPSIQGTVVGRVNGAGSCGIEGAVKLRAVAGVTLSPRATIDCPTARALKTWVEEGVLPAVGAEGGGASSLRVVSHYACRTRNNQPGGRLSEHAFGRAIDIAGIRLRDGTEMTLLTDWNSADDGAQLRQMWRAACGPFGTVLGPESNRFHRDHFHFDTARYRSGSFCR